MKMIRMAGKYHNSLQTSKKLGAGVELACLYQAHQMQTKVSFADKIFLLKSYLDNAPELKCFEREKLPLCTTEITLEGKLKDVAIGTLIKRFIYLLIAPERGLEGKISLRKEHIVFSIKSDPIELLCLLEFLKAGKSYQIVIGREKGLNDGNFIITKPNEEIPAEAHGVFFPRIDTVECKILFEEGRLPLPLVKEINLNEFLGFGWPAIIIQQLKGNNELASKLGELQNTIAEIVK